MIQNNSQVAPYSNSHPFPQGYGCSWRRECDDDQHFLFALFAEAKMSEFALLPPPAAQQLLSMQYKARSLQYGGQFPSAENLILLLDDGTPAGRLLLDRSSIAWRIVDLAVLEVYRNRCIATSAIRRVQEEASCAGARIALSVAQGNPAMQLYQRLGFQARSSEGPVFLELEFGTEHAVGNAALRHAEGRLL